LVESLGNSLALDCEMNGKNSKVKLNNATYHKDKKVKVLEIEEEATES